MSKVSKVTFNCPECGKEVEFDYYQSINVSLDPELKKKVFNADIFGAVCPHCGHLELIQHPFFITYG